MCLFTPIDILSLSLWSQSIPSMGTASSSGISCFFSWLAPDQAHCVCVHPGQGVFLLVICCADGAQLLYLSTVGNTGAQPPALPQLLLRNQNLVLSVWVGKELGTAIRVSLTLSHGKATSAPCRPFPLLRNCLFWGDLGGSNPCSSCLLARSFHPSMQRWTMWHQMPSSEWEAECLLDTLLGHVTAFIKPRGEKEHGGL